MQEQHAFPFLREILLFLALAGILIPLLARLRVNQVLGFLAAGVLLGPFGLGLLAGDLPWLSYLTFPREEGVVALAELGVIFLMFMIGLELSAARLWSLRRWVFGAGSAQVLLSAAAIGSAIWWFTGRLDTAIILGLVLSLSSTAVVMQLLTAQHSTATPLGQAAFSVLMLQDLAVVPLLILVGAMSGGASASLGVLVLAAMAKAALAIAVIYLVGGRVVQPMFRAFASHRQPDVFMALTLLTTLGIAALSAAAGLSMALGALIAGVLLAETEFTHEVELMIAPFKGLLMGLFFMTVGMGMDVRQIVAHPWLLLSAVLALIGVKALIVAMLFRLGGLPWGRAAEGGLLLGQGGEFAFIVIGYATQGALIDTNLGQMVLLAVGLSLFATPPLARLGRIIGERRQAADDAAAALRDQADLEAARGRIIIAGFGRVGRQLAKLLTEQGIAFVAFETEASLVAQARAEGYPVFFGDASRPELLRRVDAGSAPAILLTMDHAASAVHAVRGIRREFPQVALYARSRDEKHACDLKLAGATIVVPETLEAGLQLSAFALEAGGLEVAHVDRLIDAERKLFLARLSEQSVRAAAQ
ncbi:cation:proton antiporter [Massilia sp. PAMC28688]|uniref:cation:proton antiporter domain-containing protein n=1 Tax=Massilia sp. PAMC28688 TaxID=2861283 RepID=UPI001C632A28|nr:cation:proton antiporter [Massilia sp. PAMC28688]QYF94145.1 cation:proton antiporter [Massilia sp. PAMC28688]